MLLNLTEFSPEPLHLQMANQLFDKIIDGEFAAGSELPVMGSLARSQRVSLSTVKRAYADLERDGVIWSNGEDCFEAVTLTAEQRQELTARRLGRTSSPLSVFESFSSQLLAVFSPQKLKLLLENHLKQFFLAEEVCIVFLDEPWGFRSQREYEAGHFSVAGQDELIKVMGSATGPVRIGRQSIGLRSELLQELVERRMQLVIPLRSERLEGFIAVGAKGNSQRYSREDLNLLRVLANQFLTAIIAARLYAEVMEQRKLQDEMQMAQQVQSKLLPKTLPDNETFAVSAHSSTCETVSGDFYDCLRLDEHRFALVIGDACGKGLPGAMLISQIQAILKREAKSDKNLESIMDGLNDQLFEYTPKDKFATLFYGVFDIKTRSLEYVSAGQNPPVLLRQQEAPVFLKCSGPALGLAPNARYKAGNVQLVAGDTLFLYTDGVTETMNVLKEEYGERRLVALLKANANATAEAVVSQVQRALDDFQDGAAASDDRTIVVLKMRGQS